MKMEMIEVFVFVFLFIFLLYFVLYDERQEGKESLTMTVSFISNISLSSLKTGNYLRHKGGVQTKSLKGIL